MIPCKVIIKKITYDNYLFVLILLMEHKNIVIRFYLIGEKYVGKSSITSRFKILNCTKTINHSDDDFSKVFNIEGYNIEFKFHKILNPEEIKFNESYNEDDEYINKESKYNFSKVVKQIKKLMDDINDINSKVYDLFLFCFDLSNFSTLKTLQINYDELNDIINFNNSYQVLIGNKLDKKIYIDPENQSLIDVFIRKIKRKLSQIKINDDIYQSLSKQNERSIPDETKEFEDFSLKSVMPYYEISTKIFFNFEKLFEKIFYDLLHNIDPYFNNKFFKEKLSNILMIKPSFNKSKRDQSKPNNNPGPQKYENNVYSIPNERLKIKNIFAGKAKYKEKIYLNKNGPVFTSEQMENYLKKHEMKIKHQNKIDNKKETNMYSTDKNQLSADNLKISYSNYKGLTMASKQPSVKLRKERKKEFEEASRIHRSLIESFDNINNQNKRERSSDSIKLEKVRSNDSIEMEERLERIKKNNKKVEIIFKNHQKNEELRSKNLQTSLSENSISERVVSPKRTILPIIYPKPVSIEKQVGPGDYEIRGNLLSPNKGTNFSKKRTNLKRVEIEKPVAKYVRLSSEFDNVSDHPTFSLADRFNKNNNMKYRYDERANEIMKKYEQQDSIRKEKIKIIREMRIDKIKEKEKKIFKLLDSITPGPGEYEANYNSITEKSPSYTLSSKLEKLSNNGVYDDPNKLFSLEQSVSMLYKDISKALHPLPNHNYVKESGKRVVFDKYERFPQSPIKDDNQHKITRRKHIGEPLTKHYDPEKLDSFGKAIRFKRNKVYGFPGPGEYKLDDFAESLIKKNERMNSLKEKSIILKQTENVDSKSENNEEIDSDNKNHKI